MPALLRGVGLTAKRAVGTNLVIGFALGTVAFATHALLGNVDWPILAAGIAGALPGGWFGARLTGRLAEETLRRAIGVALLAISLAFLAEVVFGEQRSLAHGDDLARERQAASLVRRGVEDLDLVLGVGIPEIDTRRP
jgi:hypothetical protein